MTSVRLHIRVEINAGGFFRLGASRELRITGVIFYRARGVGRWLAAARANTTWCQKVNESRHPRRKTRRRQAESVMASASHGLVQPPQLDFDNASEWPAWIQTFDDYRYASGLNERSEEAQVRALLYTMGRQARDIFSTFHLSEDDAKKFDVVKKRFDEYFVKDRNLVYESARFHRRQQMPGETVDHFMTALHVLADRCDFGDCKERLVRDRFVVGLRDEKLSEALQMDGKLTLVTALAKARLKETVQMQKKSFVARKAPATLPCSRSAASWELTPSGTKGVSRK